MKRKTAVKLIKTHLNDYRKRLAEDGDAQLGSYEWRTNQTCPLCRTTGRYRNATYSKEARECIKCLHWPRIKTRREYTLDQMYPCEMFMNHVNDLKTARGKLALIDKLKKVLDRWAVEQE